MAANREQPSETSSFIPLAFTLPHGYGQLEDEEERDLVDSFSNIIDPDRNRPGIRITQPDEDGADIASLRPRSETSRRSRFIESVDDLNRAQSLKSLEGISLQPVGEYHSGYRDENDLFAQYAQIPAKCHSRRDVHVPRRSWAFVAPILLCAWSTCLSLLWLIAATVPFKYGSSISFGPSSVITPTLAQLLATIGAKSIELSFVAVVVTCIGQILTRRAFSKGSKGISIAEMNLRNWILQPGSIVTHWEAVPQPMRTRLGAMALVSAVAALAYTTASDALVSPKLIQGQWEDRELKGQVTANYANVYVIRDSCATPIDTHLDPISSSGSCLDVQYSGQSYRDLMAFMKDWKMIRETPNMANDTLLDMSQRPRGRHSLFDNTTMWSSWIDAEFGDIEQNFKDHKRIIHQTRLVMPHPGVYSAATDPENNILQPQDLGGIGRYAIRASVVSPTIDVLCANMNASELDPLVYTSWPDARTTDTKVPGRKIGLDNWREDVPVADKKDWFNETAVDDIFHWGSKYGRWAPAFQLFPNDWNMVVNDTTYALSEDQIATADSIYMLVKSGLSEDYTLCQLRSWVSPLCSTQFNVSGNDGGHMGAHCDNPRAKDSDSYLRYFAGKFGKEIDTVDTSADWRNLAVQWRTSMDLNGGTYDNNASNARILTHLVLQEPSLPRSLPSIAEALAVYASPTLVMGALKSPFEHFWDKANYNETYKPDPEYATFGAKVRTQQFASTGFRSWQAILYPVLVAVFGVNVMCAYVLIKSRGMVTDYMDPSNMFVLAINSPPSAVLQGSCGGGPERLQLKAPYRIGYAPSANHYYFEEAPDRFGARLSALSSGSGAALLADGSYDKSYKRLSSTRPLL